MKLLIIDNYDSFTYNLVYIVRETNVEYDVIRNDKISGPEAAEYDAILLSPGPGIPNEAGNLIDIIQACTGKIPILGICLGHQALSVSFGGALKQMKGVCHGLASAISYKDEQNLIFNQIESPFQAGRYHSWLVDEESLPNNFTVTARDEENNIMAMQDQSQSLFGLQFHPESLMTPNGPVMIHNFINFCKSRTQ